MTLPLPGPPAIPEPTNADKLIWLWERTKQSRMDNELWGVSPAQDKQLEDTITALRRLAQAERRAADLERAIDKALASSGRATYEPTTKQIESRLWVSLDDYLELEQKVGLVFSELRGITK